MPKSTSLRTRSVVLATVLLAIGPVLIPSETARWYVAAAGNAFLQKDIPRGERYLEKALWWDPDLADRPDYWMAQISRPDVNTSEGRLRMLQQAIEAAPQLAGIALLQAQEFAELGEFELALDALKIAFRGKRPTTAEGLNQLAYFRALAGVELDEALRDIVQAKQMKPDQPALEDTHAWVLHRLGRDLEALGYVNAAVRGMQQLQNTEQKPSPAVTPPASREVGSPGDSGTAAAPPPAQPDAAAESDDLPEFPSAAEQGPSVRRDSAAWTEGVIRYHRLRILEALGRLREADLDRMWLLERGMPVSDELF
jgi:tetratricopeptide (TPR) repeat protein